MAESFVKTSGKAVILCAANAMSTRVSTSNIETACLFGDAAGAIVIEPGKESFILGHNLTSKGSLSELIAVPKGGSLCPPAPGEIVDHEYSLQMTGTQVFKAAVGLMTETAQKCLETSDISIEEIDYWIPHQANQRIISAIARNLNIPPEKTLTCVDLYANTSAASIPLTLSLHRQNFINERKKKVLLSAAGSGFLAGSVLIEV